MDPPSLGKMAAEIPIMGGMMNETEVMRRTGKGAIADFLRRNTLYDLMRKSGKVGAALVQCFELKLGTCLDVCNHSALC